MIAGRRNLSFNICFKSTEKSYGKFSPDEMPNALNIYNKPNLKTQLPRKLLRLPLHWQRSFSVVCPAVARV